MRFSIREEVKLLLKTHRHESGDLLSVLDKLYTDAFSDGRVGLLGLNADLLQHDTLCVRGASGGGGLVDVAEGALLVRLIRLQFATRTVVERLGS